MIMDAISLRSEFGVGTTAGMGNGGRCSAPNADRNGICIGTESTQQLPGTNNKAAVVPLHAPARVLLVWVLLIHAVAFGLVSTFVVPCPASIPFCKSSSSGAPFENDNIGAAQRARLYENARRPSSGGSAGSQKSNAIGGPRGVLFGAQALAAAAGWARLPPAARCSGPLQSADSRRTGGPDVRSCSACCECRLAPGVQNALLQRLGDQPTEVGGHYLSQDSLSDIRRQVMLMNSSSSRPLPLQPARQDPLPPGDNSTHRSSEPPRASTHDDISKLEVMAAASPGGPEASAAGGTAIPLTGYLTWSPQSLNNRELSGLPACEVCTGCSNIFTPMPATTEAFGHSFLLGSGASHAAVMATTSVRASGGVGVAKLFCSSDGSLLDRHGSERSRCFQKKSQYMFAKVLAISGLVEEMELNLSHNFILPTWVERANGVLPSGMRVNWDVMVSDFVPSGSVSLSGLVSQHPSLATVLEILRRVPSEDVLQAAVFDLLFSICDRHSSNVFIGPGSRLTLIDHDMLTMNDTWRPCGVSSLFLPTTRKFEELIHGASYVRGTEPGAIPQRALVPQMLLDYRCHSPGGQIGTHYPEKMRKLMERVQNMTVAEVMQSYGFLDRGNAASLRDRAQAMLRHGFEHVLEHLSGNEEDHKYPWQPSCCQMTAGPSASGTGLACEHDWTPLVNPATRTGQEPLGSGQTAGHTE